MDQLVIFDTTLRDGEQSPGATMTGDEKVRIAQQLERLGVDVIEAGFAAASVGDFLAIQRISSLVKESTVCSLSRAVERDIERAGDEPDSYGDEASYDAGSGGGACREGREARP